MDNVIIFSTSPEEDIELIDIVLRMSIDYGLTLKLDKVISFQTLWTFYSMYSHLNWYEALVGGRILLTLSNI